MVTIGTAKNSSSHRPPGRTSRYGASRRRMTSAQHDRFEDLLELLLLRDRGEIAVVVQLGVVGSGREHRPAVGDALQVILVVAGLLGGVLADLLLSRRYR